VLSLTISPKKARHNLISDLSGGITDEQRRTGASKAVLRNPLSQLDFSTICSLLELGISLCDAWPHSLRTSLARERERERKREIPPQTDTVKTMAYFCGGVIKTEGRVEREGTRGRTGERKAEWKAVLSPFPQSWNREEEGGGGCNRSPTEFRVLFITGSPHSRGSGRTHWSLVLLPDVPRVNDYRHVSGRRKRAYFSRYFEEDSPAHSEAESSRNLSRNSC